MIRLTQYNFLLCFQSIIYLINLLVVQLHKISCQDMKRQVQKFTGELIQGRVQNFIVRLKLSPEQKLSISLHNQRMQANTQYFTEIKNQDIRKQSFDKGISNLIEIGTELFFLVKANIDQLHIPFNQIFQISSNMLVRINAKLLINLPSAAKRKTIKFEFQTSRVQVGFLTRMEKLEAKVKKLQDELAQTKIKLSDKKESSCISSDFETFPNLLRIKQDTVINLQRAQQFLLLKKTVSSQSQIQIKFKTNTKGVLQFNILFYHTIQELKQSNQEPSDQLLNWIECLTGDIVTLKLDERGYQVLLERNELEEVSIEANLEKEMRPTYAYTRVRKVVQFKKIINLQKAHLGIGLPFSFQISLLSLEVKTKNGQ